MTKKREVRSFPKHYLDIVMRAAEGALPVPMRVQDKRAAKAIQLDFNRFRGALLDENNPFYDVARNLIVRITNRAGPGQQGDYVVEFVTRELYNQAEELKGRPPLPPLHETDGDGLPVFKPQPAPPGLDLEKLVEKMTGVSSVPEKKECEHEADAYGVYCLKCKQSWEDSWNKPK